MQEPASHHLSKAKLASTIKQLTGGTSLNIRPATPPLQISLTELVTRHPNYNQWCGVGETLNT